MTCHKIAGAIVCTSDKFFSLEPWGAKVWCEMHWLGPQFFRSESAIKEIRKPSRKTWRAFEAWQAAQ